jgi:hypothetical protein
MHTHVLNMLQFILCFMIHTQVLDVLIRFIAASQPTAVVYGRSVFFNNPHTKIPLPGGTEAWSGFTQVRLMLLRNVPIFVHVCLCVS